QIYAAAQGPLIMGGYSAGGSANSKQVNHPTVGMIPGGALIERDSSVDLEKMTMLTILLSEPNFSTAEQVAGAINREFGEVTAKVRDGRRIEVQRGAGEFDVPAILARIENLQVEVLHRARVAVNER